MEYSKEKLISEVEKLAAPINFEELEEKGILVKAGAWYKTPSIHSLPENVRAKVIEAKQAADGSTLLKLKISTKQAEKLLNKLKET